MGVSSTLSLAKASILEPANLLEHDIDQVMGCLLGAQVDAADIYFQSSRYESWVLEDGLIKQGTHNSEQGAGVRAIAGEKTGFAYSDQLMLPALLEAANNVKAITRQGQQRQVQVASAALSPALYLPGNPLDSIDEKKDLISSV